MTFDESKIGGTNSGILTTDVGTITKKSKRLRKEILSAVDEGTLIRIKIAILGGSTTTNIKNILDLFLLGYGIQAEFYESEYDMWFEDGAFPNDKLAAFAPDFIYICTCSKNLNDLPVMKDTEDDIRDKLNNVVNKFKTVWDNISCTYDSIIIQNNFELPDLRFLGNKDFSDPHGAVNFTTRINLAFAEYVNHAERMYIADVNWLSATLGLDRWYDNFYWNLYKCQPAIPLVPHLSYEVSKIIKSLLGKNKKTLVLDMDNTLWGGVIGDDGQEGIIIGEETAEAEAYSAFQDYVKRQKDIGVILTVASKNERENALLGLQHPYSKLSEDDFVNIKANWNPKSSNIAEMAEELSLGAESFVFVDDNPVEREIVKKEIYGIAVPEIDDVNMYARVLDRAGYFEVTVLTEDDLAKTAQYQDNAKRTRLMNTFANYQDYLKSLEMTAEIVPFSGLSIPRATQLANKSNQFNLTTKRYAESEVAWIAQDSNYITLTGRLIDKFADNGIVSVVIGEIKDEALHIELWIMSCRVLKRDMEHAMLDELVRLARTKHIETIIGYYYPTKKNGMVKDFYDTQGFVKISDDEKGNSIWELNIGYTYTNKNTVIGVNKQEE